MGRPRLIVSDLDGTFLGPDGTVPDTNREAVARAAALGVPFVAATGRPIRWLGVLDDLDIAHQMVIASNGAVLWDPAGREIVEHAAIEARLLGDLLHRLRDGVPGLTVGLETVERFRCEPGTPGREPRDPDSYVELDELCSTTEPVLKVLGFHPDHSSAELAALARGLVGDVATVTHSGMDAHFGLVEIGAAGVSKASALARLCVRLGIDASEVAAFGDMPNDAEMLAWAGMPYVVANAHDSLLASGFPVVAANGDSGVGRTILDLLG